MDISAIRNIGIIAHIDAGKTTLTERILFYSNKIHRMGEVHDGTATMDFMPEEQERGITICSACTTTHWLDHQINLIDTPGHVDFTIEVERCLRVLDGAVGVFCAVSGVEPQSETVWRQSEQFGVPKLAFINKMDRPGADFKAAVSAIRKRLNANAVPIVLPVGAGDSFAGIIDLLSMEMLTFAEEDEGQTIHRQGIPDDMKAEAEEARENLLNAIADQDDAFLEAYLGGDVTLPQIQEALRRAVLARKITPVLAGSALRNAGVQPLLDAVVAYLPSPSDCVQKAMDDKGKSIELSADPKKPFVGLVFKVVMENGRKTSFMRVYQGSCTEGAQLTNTSSGKKDRTGRLVRLHADHMEQADTASAGDILAVIGLRSAHTGETYTDGPALHLESIESTAPVITIALEPRNADEGKILDEALARYCEEDPTLIAHVEEESGLRTLSGMGELHLDVTLERLRREYRIDPRTGAPKVTLRETATKEASASYTFDRELGQQAHYGNVSLTVLPRARGEGNIVRTGDFLPEDGREAALVIQPQFVAAALEGARDCLQSGDLTGYPVTDVEVVITGIEKKDGINTVPGCHMAAHQALKEALAKADPVILEPVMRVTMTMPESELGSAIGLFGSVGGRVDGMEDQAGIKTVHGTAPMRQLFGFSTRLRSATQGRAGMMVTFDRFDKA